MAVLVEGISVIVLAKQIVSNHVGGWEAFKRKVPNQTMCADDELIRVGFMHPDDVQDYVATLEVAGLRHITDGAASDMVVADQQRGFTTACQWAHFGHINLGGDPAKRVAACMLAGSNLKQIVFPEDWNYDDSLTAAYGFAPNGFHDTLNRVGDVDGYQAWQSALSEKPLYIARTAQISAESIKKDKARRQILNWGRT